MSEFPQINDYFKEFQKRVEDRRRDLVSLVEEAAESKTKVLQKLGDRLPDMIRSSGDAADRVGESVRRKDYT
jgi:hypothetical protein